MKFTTESHFTHADFWLEHFHVHTLGYVLLLGLSPEYLYTIFVLVLFSHFLSSVQFSTVCSTVHDTSLSSECYSLFSKLTLSIYLSIYIYINDAHCFYLSRSIFLSQYIFRAFSLEISLICMNGA